MRISSFNFNEQIFHSTINLKINDYRKNPNALWIQLNFNSTHFIIFKPIKL